MTSLNTSNKLPNKLTIPDDLGEDYTLILYFLGKNR